MNFISSQLHIITVSKESNPKINLVEAKLQRRRLEEGNWSLTLLLCGLVIALTFQNTLVFAQDPMSIFILRY